VTNTYIPTYQNNLLPPYYTTSSFTLMTQATIFFDMSVHIYQIPRHR